MFAACFRLVKVVVARYVAPCTNNRGCGFVES